MFADTRPMSIYGQEEYQNALFRVVWSDRRSLASLLLSSATPEEEIGSGMNWAISLHHLPQVCIKRFFFYFDTLPPPKKMFSGLFLFDLKSLLETDQIGENISNKTCFPKNFSCIACCF